MLQLPKAMLDSLGLSDELREAVDRARAIISHGAIRREERYLAGLLRQIDIDDLEKRLATLQKAGQAEAHHFHQAETWRKRLIEEGEPALEAFVKRFAGADPSALLTRVAEAQREKATGSPRGAARALFRQVMAAMHPNIGPDQGPMAKRKLGD